MRWQPNASGGLMKKIRHNRTGAFWPSVLPVFLPFAILFIIQFLMSIFYSFLKWNGLDVNMEFVGLKNYITILSEDTAYKTSVMFTVKYALITVVITNALALALAAALNNSLRTSAILRSIFFFPNIISPIIAGFIWLFMFSRGATALYDITGMALFGSDWLGDPQMALYSIVIVQVWMTAGYTMLIYLAGLQTLDKNVLEAADIDGASKGKRFIHVVLPLIMPSITANLFMTLTQCFRVFDLIVALTRGGPAGTTVSMAYDIYTDAFANNMTGYASAKAVLLFIFVFFITMVQLGITKKREV